MMWPASASSDYGTPFYDIFKRYDNDFYKIDPLLFRRLNYTDIDPMTELPFTSPSSEGVVRSWSAAGRFCARHSMSPSGAPGKTKRNCSRVVSSKTVRSSLVSF